MFIEKSSKHVNKRMPDIKYVYVQVLTSLLAQPSFLKLVFNSKQRDMSINMIITKYFKLIFKIT